MAIELEDGTVILSLPEQVEQNKTKVEEVDIKVDNLAARVEAALAGILHFKGSVATYSDLPADAEIGDVYNVIDTGADYAWTGSEWDELGSVVDLSNFVTLDSAQYIDSVKTFRKTGATPNRAIIRFANTGYDVPFGLDGGEMFSSTSFKPLASGEYDLGLVSNKWKDLYLSNALNLGTSGILKYDSDISSFTSNSHISPAVDLNYTLGTSDHKWKRIYSKEIYLKGSEGGTRALQILDDNGYNAKIVHGGVQQFMFLGGDITSNTIKPETNSKTLGTPSNLWKNIYVSGDLSDGTNSVNVADLKALIDYAKAQGWIS